MANPRLSYVCGVPAHKLLSVVEKFTYDGERFEFLLTSAEAQTMQRAYNHLVRELDQHQGLDDQEFQSLILAELFRRTIIASGTHPQDLALP
jgi:hypothetical protein